MYNRRTINRRNDPKRSFIVPDVVKLGPTTIQLRWDVVGDDYLPNIQGYKVKMGDEGGNKKIVYMNAQAECIIDSLQPGKEYKFWVCAYNSIEGGFYSHKLSVRTPLWSPRRPINIIAGLNKNNSVEIAWDKPVHHSGFALPSVYHIHLESQMSPRPCRNNKCAKKYVERRIVCGMRTRINVGHELSNHIVRVRAIGANGEIGQWSKLIVADAQSNNPNTNRELAKNGEHFEDNNECVMHSTTSQMPHHPTDDDVDVVPQPRRLRGVKRVGWIGLIGFVAGVAILRRN